MSFGARLAVGALLAMSFAAPAARAEELFSGRLDTVPIDARTQATTTGGGRVTAELDGDELVLDGTFEGLAGPATTAWIHIGPAVGARGPAAYELKVSLATSGSIGGAVTLGRRELAALRGGRLYVQIHSESAPDGNLWGWLLPRE